MPEINTIDSLRKWFRKCPVISKERRFNINYLKNDPTEYTIYTVPSSLATQTDILGNTTLKDTQTLNFIFASREAYGSDVLQNLSNLGFFDAIMEWIYQQNATKNLPEIHEGKTISIMPTLTPYAFQTGTDSARYQIQLAMKYRRNLN